MKLLRYFWDKTSIVGSIPSAPAKYIKVYLLYLDFLILKEYILNYQRLS